MMQIGKQPVPKSDTQWKKGQSGNPGGRPKNHGQAGEEARKFAIHAIYSLVQNCTDRRSSWRDRRQAARLLIRIGFGPNAGAGDGVLKTLGWENVRRRLDELSKFDAQDNGEEVITRLRRPHHGEPYHHHGDAPGQIRPITNNITR